MEQQQQQSLLRSPPSYYHTSQSCYHLLILIVVTLATTSLLPVHGVVVDCPLGHATNVPGCPPKTLWSLSADTEMVEDAPSKWRMVGGASASIKPSQITSDGSNELDLRRDGAVAQDDGGPHLQRTDGGTLLGGAAFSFCAWVTFEEETTKFSCQNAVLLSRYGDRKLTFDVYAGERRHHYTVDEGVPAAGIRTHLCATVSDAGVMKVIRDGKHLPCTGCTDGVVNAGQPFTRMLRPRSFIGRSNFKDEPNYIGQIASVFIIDGHAVTETEARALMAPAVFQPQYEEQQQHWFAGLVDQTCSTVCRNVGRECPTSEKTRISNADEMFAVSIAAGIYGGQGCNPEATTFLTKDPTFMSAWFRAPPMDKDSSCYYTGNVQQCNHNNINNDALVCYCDSPDGNAAPQGTNGMWATDLVGSAKVLTPVNTVATYKALVLAQPWEGGQGERTASYAEVRDGTTIGGGAMTLCALVRFDAFGAYSRILDFGNGNGVSNILFENNADGSDFRFDIWTAGGLSAGYSAVIADYPGGFWRIGKWVHACITVSIFGEYTIYRNGVEIPCTAGTACRKRGLLPERVKRANSYIGHSRWSSEDPRYSAFHGSISNVLVYDGYALTQDEVIQLYGQALFYQSNALVECNFETTATTATATAVSLPSSTTMVTKTLTPSPISATTAPPTTTTIVNFSADNEHSGSSREDVCPISCNDRGTGGLVAVVVILALLLLCAAAYALQLRALLQAETAKLTAEMDLGVDTSRRRTVAMVNNPLAGNRNTNGSGSSNHVVQNVGFEQYAEVDEGGGGRGWGASRPPIPSPLAAPAAAALYQVPLDNAATYAPAAGMNRSPQYINFQNGGGGGGGGGDGDVYENVET